MAGRGLGWDSVRATQSCLALRGPTLLVHIQGNLSTGFKGTDVQGQERMPVLSPARTGPAPSYIGPNFLCIPELVWLRAGVQICSVESNQPFRPLRPSPPQVGQFNNTFINRCLWRAKYTLVPSGLWEPCCSQVLTNMVPKAKVSQLNGIVRAGADAGAAPLSTGHAHPAQRLFCWRGEAQVSWLLGAVLEGDQPGPADKRGCTPLLRFLQ